MIITSTNIENTEAFRLITCPVQKQLTINKTSRQKITEGVNQSKSVGFDRWVEMHQPIDRIRKIVKELLTAN